MKKILSITMALFVISSIKAQNPLLIPPALIGPNFNLTIDYDSVEFFPGQFTIEDNSTSIVDYNNTNKILLKTIDVFGRETKGTNQPLFYIYDDGTVEKKIVVE